MLMQLRKTSQLPIFPTIFLTLFTLANAESVSVNSSGIQLSRALSKSKSGDTLVLEPGTYRGRFIVPAKVHIIAEKRHEAVIKSNGQNRGVLLLNGSTIAGVCVTGAKVGIYSEGTNNKIIGCKIYGNTQSGIVAVSTIPVIRDNIIYRNSGSGITLWDVKRADNPVSHNTIVYNANHGISIGGDSHVKVEDNIIAFNQKLTLKVTDQARVEQFYNNYFFNVEINEQLPNDNYSFDPRFKDPFFNDFSLRDDSRCINNGSNGSTIGSEIFNKPVSELE